MSYALVPCKGCGKKIIWGETYDGKRIPLDPSAPVYALVGTHDRHDVVRTNMAMVSHFVTCPEANRFSASHKKPVAAPVGSAVKP